MRLPAWILLPLLGFPLRLFAEPIAQQGMDKARPALPTSAVSGGDLVQLTLGLLAVLAIIFALAWVLRRSGQFSATSHGHLRLLGGLSLGARERIVLVQVGQQQLLLGVAPGRVQTLHVLDEASRIETSGSVVGSGVFAAKLARVMGKQQ